MGVAVRNSEYNTRYKDIGGTVKIATTDGDTTLVTVSKSTRTIFIQELWVEVTVDGARTWSFEDSNATPRKIASMPASPGLGRQNLIPWSPQGVALTEGKNFVLNVSAADIEGTIHWEGYERPTAASVAAGNRADGIGV